MWCKKPSDLHVSEQYFVSFATSTVLPTRFNHFHGKIFWNISHLQIQFIRHQTGGHIPQKPQMHTNTHDTCHEIKEIKINEFRSFVWVCVEIRCDCTISMKPCSHSILMNYYICMVIKLINELILHWFLKSYFKSRHSVPALSIFAHFKNRLEPACNRSVIVEFNFFFCEKCRDLKRQIE